MSDRRRVASFACLALLGCGDQAPGPAGPVGPPRPANAAVLRVMQTGSRSVDVLVNGQAAMERLTIGELGEAFIDSGTHQVALRQTGSSDVVAATTIPFPPYDTVMAFVIDTSGALGLSIFAEPNASVTAGKSMLRVLHFAADEPIVGLWGMLPNAASYTLILSSFRYKNATAYLEGEPGDWSILVSNATGPAMSDTLLEISRIDIQSGRSRTVVLIDGMQATVIRP